MHIGPEIELGRLLEFNVINALTPIQVPPNQFLYPRIAKKLLLDSVQQPLLGWLLSGWCFIFLLQQCSLR